MAANALPERRVTVHTGDMGYTFGLCEESEGALAGVQPYGRTSQIHCAGSGWREDSGCAASSASPARPATRSSAAIMPVGWKG